MLVAEKDTGLQKLNTAIENGEKLYPDTSAPGREKIRQQLRLAKDVWDGLVADLTDAQHKAETSAAQVCTCIQKQGFPDYFSILLITKLVSLFVYNDFHDFIY